MGRVIFHIDMNSFFVSCEIAENPDLFGKCVAVVPYASSRKSIVLAASYEAKAKGIKTTMHINEALKRCPELIVVDCNHHLYSEYSQKFFNYFYSITPLVEPASIDEGFLDVTDQLKDIDAISLAIKMQKDILEQFHLPCSIGIGPNKFLAKMASDMKKPLGITVLRKREVPEKLWPLPIEDLLGVGKKTAPVLRSIGINTIGDLATFSNQKLLVDTIGPASAESLVYHANGNGSAQIDTNRWQDPASISNSYTFDADEYDLLKVKQTMKILTNSVCNRLEKAHQKAQTFTVQIKYNNIRSYSKSKTVPDAINDSTKVYQIMEDLFDEVHDAPFGIRLIGVGASKLKSVNEKQRQLSIFDSFDEAEKENTINKLIKNINADLGGDILKRGLKDQPK